MQSDRPVFVLGCPRSGTTLLQLMLHSHPRIAIPPETRFLLPAYTRRRAYGDMRQAANRLALAQWIATDPATKFGELGLSADDYVKAAVDGPGSFGSVVGRVFKCYAERFAKPRWGDKRPSYFAWVGVLRRLFPDAQFIHLVRDGRDCVASLKEMPWYPHDVFHAVATWAEAMDHGRAHLRRLPPDTFLELRYEDLTADPETELRRICAFLGEEYDPAMCEPHRMADIAVPAHKVWHRNTRGDITQDRVGRWAERLEPWEISLCETVLGDRLAAHGYRLTGAPPAAREHLAAYRATVLRRRVSRFKQRLRDRMDRLREAGPVPALLTSGQLALAGQAPPPYARRPR